ncbi:15294_t:CDS:2, partial [Gigaspora margarita]
MPINLHDIIKKWNTEKLIEFLRNQKLNLDEEDFSCLRSQKISGPSFLLLEEKHLIDCKLKMGPIVTLLKLITEINTGELSSEKLIPVLNDIKNSKWLYSRYFYTFPFNKWSHEHYKNWILSNYPTSKKEAYNRCFFKIIRKIKEDSKTLEEIREFVSKLDGK